MTGFALARRDTSAGTVVFEVRSVNSRFLDPQFRTSDELRAGEAVLREALATKVSRGKLDCRFYVNRTSQGALGIDINRAAVDVLARLDGEVRHIVTEAAPLRVSEILHWPGVLASAELTAEQVTEIARELGREAIDQLIEARGREGAKLATIIIERVDAMDRLIANLTPRIAEFVAAHQQKLVDRLSTALGVTGDAGATNAAVSRAEIMDRIRQEVSLFGMRIDVAEELSRLSAHLTETRHILAKGGPCGKRLDFMMQELNREANTLGSKSAAVELADAAMEFKLLIEQMREQVQNLE
jgi:uncharacterized protein (TIGR00255 family)